MQINEQKVGSVCNSLNAMEGAYRHKGPYELNTKLDHDTEFFLHQAQEMIWSLWDLVKENEHAKKTSPVMKREE